MADRRLKVRFEIVGQLWGSLEAVESLAIRNVGREGMLLESSNALPVDSVHRLRLTLGEVSSELQARVCHVTPANELGDRFLIGLEFVELSQTVRASLDQVVATQTVHSPSADAHHDRLLH